MTKQDLSKKVWYDPDANGYIGLDVSDDIPAQTKLTIESTELLPKSEYHSSLVAIRRYVDDREEEQSIADAVKGYLQSHDLRYVGLGDERYLCRKDNKMTVVAPVKIDGIDELRKFIKTRIPDYQPPFSHVTILKSEATEFGVPINSMGELVQYCEKLDGNIGRICQKF
jgi:hypothetical protein